MNKDEGLTPRTVKVLCPPCFHCHQRAIVEVVEADYIRWQNGAMAQSAFPEMPADRREMLISGTHPKCWDEMFADNGDEDDDIDDDDGEG